MNRLLIGAMNARSLRRSLFYAQKLRPVFTGQIDNNQPMCYANASRRYSASTEATESDQIPLEKSTLAANLPPSKQNKGILVVKDYVISFDLIPSANGDEGNQRLQITEYLLDGSKDAEMTLHKNEAQRLSKSLKKMAVGSAANKCTAKLKIGPENHFEVDVDTTKKNTGPPKFDGLICVIHHRKGLYTNNQPLNVPWQDIEKFQELIASSLDLVVVDKDE